MSNPLSRALLPGGILRIGLNSPKVNAINLSLLEELARAFQFASVSSDVRSVLLASDNPKVFSAGLDLSQLSGYIKAGDRSALAHFGFTAMDAAFLGPSKCPKPVAAAVDGHAIAGAWCAWCASRSLCATGYGIHHCLCSVLMCVCYVCVFFTVGPHVRYGAGGLILGLACDYFVMNPRNTNMRLGLTELQVSSPSYRLPLSSSLCACFRWVCPSLPLLSP